MRRPRSGYVSAFDKIDEGVKVITSRLLARLGDRADEAWDALRFNRNCLADLVVDLIVEEMDLASKSASIKIHPPALWHKNDGVVHFQVTSDGTSGEQWIRRLIRKGGFRPSVEAERVLLSEEFKPTSGVTTKIVIFRATRFKNRSDDSGDTIIERARNEAKDLGLRTPKAEVACLIREMFSDKEIRSLRLSRIIVMHRPVSIASAGWPALLEVNNIAGEHGNDMTVRYPSLGQKEWLDETGLAFVEP